MEALISNARASVDIAAGLEPSDIALPYITIYGLRVLCWEDVHVNFDDLKDTIPTDFVIKDEIKTVGDKYIWDAVDLKFIKLWDEGISKVVDTENLSQYLTFFKSCVYSTAGNVVGTIDPTGVQDIYHKDSKHIDEQKNKIR